MTKPGHLRALAVAMVLLFPVGVSSAQSSSAPAPGSDATKRPLPMLDLRRQQPMVGNAQAGASRAAVCSACHGPKGIAIAPNFPNLAGQSATFLYVQLREFKDGHRIDPIMSGQAASLSEENMRDIASYYGSLPPKPAGATDAGANGGRLYLSGEPGRGIPPCQGCHGVDGLGPRPLASNSPQPPWSTFPRLRGQSALYVSKTLHDFRSGAREGNSNAKVMSDIARTLSDDDIQSISTYLSTR